MSESGQLPTWWRKRDAAAGIAATATGGRIRSDRTFRRVKHVCDAGIPELKDAMDYRRVSIAAADLIANLPADVQIKCVTDAKLRRLILTILRSRE